MDGLSQLEANARARCARSTRDIGSKDHESAIAQGQSPHPGIRRWYITDRPGSH